MTALVVPSSMQHLTSLYTCNAINNCFHIAADSLVVPHPPTRRTTRSASFSVNIQSSSNLRMQPGDQRAKIGIHSGTTTQTTKPLGLPSLNLAPIPCCRFTWPSSLYTRFSLSPSLGSALAVHSLETFKLSGFAVPLQRSQNGLRQIRTSLRTTVCKS